MPFMETKLRLRYVGPGVETGQMPVHEAAANMVAFSEFVVLATKALYGPDADARAQVSGFAQSSFVTNLVFEVAGPMVSLLGIHSAKDLFDVVRQAFELWKFLEGKPPAAVRPEGDQIIVENNNGQIFNVRSATFNLILSDKAGEAAQRFVGAALSRDGVERVEVADEHGNAAVVRSAEARYFRTVMADVPISSGVLNQTLLLDAPNFKAEDSKWRFSDGQTSFAATIEDDEFLASVDRGEPFRKGDRLEVEMRIEQIRRGGKYHVERTIQRVFAHRPAADQSDLFVRAISSDPEAGGS